jgi:hypothetical protein
VHNKRVTARIRKRAEPNPAFRLLAGLTDWPGSGPLMSQAITGCGTPARREAFPSATRTA